MGTEMKFTEAFIDELAKIGGPVADSYFARVKGSQAELTRLKEKTKLFKDAPSATTGRPR